MGPNVDKLFLEIAGSRWSSTPGSGSPRPSALMNSVVVRDGNQSAFEELAGKSNSQEICAWLPVARSGRIRLERSGGRWRRHGNRGHPGRRRPCTSEALIAATIAAARKVGAAVAAQRWPTPSRNRVMAAGRSGTLDRSRCGGADAADLPPRDQSGMPCRSPPPGPAGHG